MMSLWLGALFPNCLIHKGILPLLSNTRGCICLLRTGSPLLMLRRKLGLRTDDLKKLKVKPVPTCCTSRSHMVKSKTKLSRIRIIIIHCKLVPLIIIIRRRRVRIASCADLLIIGQRSVQIVK
jgi:hypothetical protein